jgi:hypothetical protein
VIGLDKSHPEFKELFGWVYRGVGFALVSIFSLNMPSLFLHHLISTQRAQMKIQSIDATLIDRLVQTHVAMYVGGQGGTPEEISRRRDA